MKYDPKLPPPRTSPGGAVATTTASVPRFTRRDMLALATGMMGLAAAVTAVLASAPGAEAADTSDYVVVGDVLIYFAVVPAELLRAFPKDSSESRMHGGVPKGKHSHHLMVALFDAKTNDRIGDAKVVARISEVGLAATALPLEPFTVQDALTYGNYFEFEKLALYEIGVSVTRPGQRQPVETTFRYRHH